ncbi:MAG TPA: proton-conducting transporter membrane subunit [Bacteroidales bacterium]|nr:proton-conducting transporter membrane subunit [Bacteroidales bacterium]
MDLTTLVNISFCILLLLFISLFFLTARNKGIATLSVVIVISLLSSYVALRAIAGVEVSALLSGPAMFGNIPLKIDPLSAWFILVISFTMITGAVYGLNYMKAYIERESEITLHCISYVLVNYSLIGVCLVNNSFVFLLLWEILALSVFMLVIFDGKNPEVIKAGINYLVQSHISIVLLMAGFLYYAIKTGSYNFSAITQYSANQSSLAGTALFLLFFAGFALKAGFIPFHTWLPLAHPAAPSHVSGIMSGVVIKIGIFGILKMLLLMRIDYAVAGYFILFISIISGIYGVMLAIVQHDLKRLLAYHSIENIGIIGIGIGVGCIGLGFTNKWMAILGFSGALLHTLNHSLFKSLLFYSAGNVLQATHTVNIERLGGLIKRMPSTAILFLVAALAICGLPPLNGFISEFLIYGGLYNWLYSAGVISQVAIIFALTGLVLIGGLAILCFTKAFSIVFLGTPRSDYKEKIEETGKLGLVPMYMTAALMLGIGLFPSFFLKALQRPVNQFTGNIVFNMNLIRVGAIDSLATISWLFLGFIILIIAVAVLRKLATAKKEVTEGPTWGCGYPYAGSKLQYTANSFVRSYSKLAKPVLDIKKKEDEITEIYPKKKHYATHPFDKVEKILIDKPLSLLNRFTDSFLFLQNGRLQRYILYGIIFIVAILLVPMFFQKVISMIELLKTL